MATAIVPARLGSTRFPRKVLADETGRPMIVHVLERAGACESIARVVVATDAPEVIEAAAGAGFEGVLTGEHENGTSRIEEATRLLGLGDDEVVVNVQGDEPEIEPGVIELGVRSLLDLPGADVGTVAAPGDAAAAGDPNIVKVAVDDAGRALYFSRAPIPFDRDGVGVPVLRHVGLYAYRVGFLRRYVSMEAGALERAERLEQLRVLERGGTIGVGVWTGDVRAGIDTPEQYAEFVARQRGG